MSLLLQYDVTVFGSVQRCVFSGCADTDNRTLSIPEKMHRYEYK